MQTFNTAPKNQSSFNKLGYAYKIATAGIIIGTVIGIITEVLPLYTIASTNIAPHLSQLIGNYANGVIFVIVIALILYLALENINTTKALFYAVRSKDARKTIGGVAIAVIACYFVFILIGRMGLTFIGSHQLANEAIKAPVINFDNLNTADSLKSERQKEVAEMYNEQRKALITDNKSALNATRKALQASEAAAERKIKTAANEYRKGLAQKELDLLRRENAEKLAVVAAKQSESLIQLNNAKTYALTSTDSLHNGQKSLLINADNEAQQRYMWLSGKMKQYMPFISVFSVIFVTLCTILLCQVMIAAEIETEFQMGKYDNMPSMLTITVKAFGDIFQSWVRWSVTKLKDWFEIDIAKGGTIAAAAVGAGGTLEVTGKQDVVQVQIVDKKEQQSAKQKQAQPLKAKEPAQEYKETYNEKPTGKTITHSQATARLNTHKHRLKTGEGNPATQQKNIDRYTKILAEMERLNVRELQIN